MHALKEVSGSAADSTNAIPFDASPIISEKPLAILLLTTHAGDGGDWVVIERLCGRLIEHGHTVNVAGRGICHAKLPEGVKGIELPLNKGIGGLMQSYRMLWRLPQHFDIVHTHSPRAALLGILLRPRLKAPVVMTCHLQVDDRRLRRLSKRLLLHRLDLIHCVSEEMAEWISRRYSLETEKVQVVHNGVSEARHQPASREERTAIRAQYGLSSDQLVVCFVGRLNPEKNISYLLRFLAHHGGEFPQLVIVIAGNGPMEHVLKTEAEQLRVHSRIKFLGHVPDPRNVYAMSDLCVLPSAYESFSLVVIEAFLCSVPVLRSNSGGSRSQIIPGVTGACFSQGNEADFHHQLRGMLSAPDELRVMGSNARRRALILFSEDLMLQRIEALYQRLKGLRGIDRIAPC